jgi:hypothetical protein
MVRTSSASIVLMLVGLISSATWASDAPDLSTPKKAAVSFAKSIESGDMANIKATSVGTDDDYKLVQSIVGLIEANKQLRAAAIAKFGEEGKQISTEDLSNISKQMEAGDEKIDGETATIGKADEKDPMKLKKIGDSWKVDLASIPEKEQMGKAMPKMQKVMSEAAVDIKAGKYKTIDDAKQAIGQQIFAVVAEQLNPPQPQPQTGPVPPGQPGELQK